ncbi:hypothetical protein ISR92_03080 [Patescibacteria group bacterium]|nr:hypothetical protein [Patescibacteria group bacterium]
MIDFLHKQTNKEVIKEKKPEFKERRSWLRGLLHPVNGDKKGESIDLLATAKKQMVDLPKEEFKPIKQDKPKKIKKEKVKKDLSFNKILSTDGSAKIRKGFDVNLLPATFSFQSTSKLMTILSVWLIFVLIVLAALYMGIAFYGQRVTEEALALEVEIEVLDSKIVTYNSDVADAGKWQIKLATVDSLLRSHVYWTNFFTVLETTTLPEVYYSGFTASLVNSDINLSSYAKSFTTVAEQLIAYERFPEVFGSFSVAEASLDEGIGISYNALVNLYRDIFYDQSFVEKK